jgi:hypothetical protein
VAEPAVQPGIDAVIALVAAPEPMPPEPPPETPPRPDPEIAILRDRLAAIENSTSWRLTAPLRLLVDQMRARGRRSR